MQASWKPQPKCNYFCVQQLHLIDSKIHNFYSARWTSPLLLFLLKTLHGLAMYEVELLTVVSLLLSQLTNMGALVLVQVSPEYLQDICNKLFSSHVRQTTDFTRPGTAGKLLRQSVSTQPRFELCTTTGRILHFQFWCYRCFSRLPNHIILSLIHA